MAGVRIKHPTAHSGVFLVRHFRRYPVPIHCERCQTFHIHKTYHLDLDADGTVIVSTTVFERLKEVGLAGFSMVNVVKRPPPISLEIPNVIQNKFRVFKMGVQEKSDAR